MVKFNYVFTRVTSSSLIEVTTSMVITGIVFSAALMIVLNISSGSDSLHKTKYEQVLREMAYETIRNKAFISTTINDGPITIDKEIMEFPGNSQLIVVKFSAWRQEKELAKLKMLIYAPIE